MAIQFILAAGAVIVAACTGTAKIGDKEDTTSTSTPDSVGQTDTPKIEDENGPADVAVPTNETLSPDIYYAVEAVADAYIQKEIENAELQGKEVSPVEILPNDVEEAKETQPDTFVEETKVAEDQTPVEAFTGTTQEALFFTCYEDSLKTKFVPSENCLNTLLNSTGTVFVTPFFFPKGSDVSTVKPKAADSVGSCYEYPTCYPDPDKKDLSECKKLCINEVPSDPIIKAVDSFSFVMPNADGSHTWLVKNAQGAPIGSLETKSGVSAKSGKFELSLQVSELSCFYYFVNSGCMLP